MTEWKNLVAVYGLKFEIRNWGEQYKSMKAKFPISIFSVIRFFALLEMTTLDSFRSGTNYHKEFMVMKKDRKKQCMIFIISFGLLLAMMGHGYADQETGEYEKKITLLNEELEHCQDESTKKEILLKKADLHFYQAKAFEKELQYESAIKHYKLALIINQDYRSEYAAADLNNIGAVYKNMGKYAKALENYEKSLAICLNVLGPEHPSTATLYNGIGLVYYNMGEYEKVLYYCAKALPIAEKSGDVELKWRVLDAMSGIHKKLDRPSVAIFFG